MWFTCLCNIGPFVILDQLSILYYLFQVKLKINFHYISFLLPAMHRYLKFSFLLYYSIKRFVHQLLVSTLQFIAPKPKLTIACTTNGLKHLQHSPNSLDLAPWGFALFPHVKMKLKGKNFFSYEDLLMAWENKCALLLDDTWQSWFKK